jgi:hypothetical protein
MYVRQEFAWLPSRRDKRCAGVALRGTDFTGRRNNFAGRNERLRVVFGTIVPTLNAIRRIIQQGHNGYGMYVYTLAIILACDYGK